MQRSPSPRAGRTQTASPSQRFRSRLWGEEEEQGDRCPMTLTSARALQGRAAALLYRHPDPPTALRWSGGRPRQMIGLRPSVRRLRRTPTFGIRPVTRGKADHATPAIGGDKSPSPRAPPTSPSAPSPRREGRREGRLQTPMARSFVIPCRRRATGATAGGRGPMHASTCARMPLCEREPRTPPPPRGGRTDATGLDGRGFTSPHAPSAG